MYSILAYLFFTINSSGANLSSSQNNTEESEILKIGVLLPLSGEFQETGESLLKAIQLALFEISNENIKIYPKDTKANAFDTYNSAKEFDEQGIKIVIGPVFHESLERLEEISNITFISFTNKTINIPKNTIAFGINIESQIDTLKNYFNEKKISKTILLSPKLKFNNELKWVTKKKDLNFYRTYLYDSNPKKITNEIKKITNYKERKKDLERRVAILEKSDLYKDKQELEILKQKHTLGKVKFDSVFVIDFGESLKSVITSFIFSDISSNEVSFFTVNQWFDKTFFNESALLNLHFPAIDFKNFNKFNSNFLNKFNEEATEISILAYDALALIYYCWLNNDYHFKKNQLYDKNGFKGKHAEFVIENNISKQKLKIYKVHENKFIKVY